MSTVTISLPDALQAWLDDRAQVAGFENASDYVRELIERDREGADGPLTLEELRDLVRDAKASGFSDRSVEEIFAEAQATVAKRRG